MESLPQAQAEGITAATIEGTRATGDLKVADVDPSVVDSSETPSTLLKVNCERNLTQGRLLFPASLSSDKGVPPNLVDGKGAMVPEAHQACSLIDSTQSDATATLPSHCPQTQPSSNIATPPEDVSTSVPTRQSGKPKVKVTKTERDALRLQREQLKAEIQAFKEKEKLRKEQEKFKRELEKKARLEQDERLKQEKREQKERERKEKQEKKETEKRKREEEKKRKEEERKRKEEERRRREEERKRKEEEKRQVEMEKKQIVEEKLRKEQKAKEMFAGFFSKMPKNEARTNDVSTESKSCVFTKFEVQQCMTIAPLPRSPLPDTSLCDQAIREQNCSKSYLLERKELGAQKRREKEEVLSGRCSDDMECDDVIVMSSPNAAKPKFKLLQFHSNARPAYFGSWRRRSKVVSGRNPFRMDKSLLDYEFDSDDEWEEEEPGESVSSDSEGDEESGDESEEDDGFFVPHGYLSEDEGERSDSERGPDGDEMAKVKAKAKAWETEFQRTCQPKKATLIGCLWVGEEDEEQQREFLQQFSAMALVDTPVKVESASTTGQQETQGSTGADALKRPVPEEAMPDLISLVHNSSMGLNRLVKTFRTLWGRKVLDSRNVCTSSPPPSTSGVTSPSTSLKETDYENTCGISKRQLEMKIQQIASKGTRAPFTRNVWIVHDSVLQHYKIDPSHLLSHLPPTPKPQNGGEKQSVTPDAISVTPSNKKGMKRKMDGQPTITVKSLFEAIAKSPQTAKVAALEGPSEKKRKTQDMSSPENGRTLSMENLQPPNKKIRLETECMNPSTQPKVKNPPSPPQPGTVIVIHGEDSEEGHVAIPPNPSNTKANHSLSLHSIKKQHPTARLHTVKQAPPTSGAPTTERVDPPSNANSLQERTNQLGGQGMEEELKPRINWKELIQNSNPRNVIVTTAEIH